MSRIQQGVSASPCRAGAVRWRGTVPLPDAPDLSPLVLRRLDANGPRGLSRAKEGRAGSNDEAGGPTAVPCQTRRGSVEETTHQAGRVVS